MSKIHISIFYIILITYFLSCKVDASESNISLGNRLYKMHCASCHLEDGNGVDGVNPKLKYIDNKYNKEQILQIITMGSLYFNQNTRENNLIGYMPQFSQLSSEEKDAIISYISSEFR